MAYTFQLTSFLHAKEAVLAVGALVIAGLMLMERGRPGVRAWFLPLWLLLLFAVGTGALRARVPALVLEDAVRWFVLLLLIVLVQDLFLRPLWRRRIWGAVLLSAGLVAALGVVQYFDWAPRLFPRFPGYDQRVYSVFGNQDLFGGYLAVALPLAAAAPAVLFRGRLALPVIMLLSFALVLSGSRTAWLAAGLGLAVLLWQRHGHFQGDAASPRHTGRAIALAGVALLLALLLTWPDPLARVVGTFGEGDVGGHARLWFWDGTLRMIAAEPFLGVGLGNFAYWSPHYLGAALHGRWGRQHFANELHTQHAHSEVLELLAETGIVGAVLAGWMLLRLAPVRGPEWGGLAALLVFALFNAGFHSAPHALLGLTLAGLLLGRRDAAHATGEARESAGEMRQGAGLPRRVAVVGLALALLATHTHTTLLPSLLLTAAEDAHLAGDPRAEARYLDALAHRWPQPDAHEAYAILLLNEGRAVEAAAQLRAALRAKDTGRLHLLAARAAHALGRQSEAEQHMAACLWRWPFSERAHDLARALHTR